VQALVVYIDTPLGIERFSAQWCWLVLQSLLQRVLTQTIKLRILISSLVSCIVAMG
jgi:hypothetical protein